MCLTQNYSSANGFLFGAFFSFSLSLPHFSASTFSPLFFPSSPSVSSHPVAFCQSLSGFALQCSWFWQRNTPYTCNSDSVNMLGLGSRPQAPDTVCILPGAAPGKWSRRWDVTRRGRSQIQSGSVLNSRYQEALWPFLNMQTCLDLFSNSKGTSRQVLTRPLHRVSIRKLKTFPAIKYIGYWRLRWISAVIDWKANFNSFYLSVYL